MKTPSAKPALVRVERIARTIVRRRGQHVMRDVDLAALYQVTTKRLNEQVKRNRGDFRPISCSSRLLPSMQT